VSLRLAPLLSCGSFFVCLAGCLGTVGEVAPAVYHNPLDILDSGVPTPPPDSGMPPDSGLPPGPDSSTGTVDGHTPQFASAIYEVVTTGGPPRTFLYVADLVDLCALARDGGLGPSWTLLRFHLAGDTPASYPVASILPPSGATAELDFLDQSGAYGFAPAVGGSVQLDSVDPGNTQPTNGSYTLDFGDAGSLVGRFSADPCSATPPQAGT
jgi:hypothetical protein